jgi:hypothetical protein
MVVAEDESVVTRGSADLLPVLPATPDVPDVYTIKTIKRVSTCARRFALATCTLDRKRYVRTRSPSCAHGRKQ